MKRILLLIAVVLVAGRSMGQITITAADMPVSGDTLRYSFANPIGSGINLADSGASFTWNYSTLTPTRQAVDTFKSALSVSFTYFLISTSAYGYKFADTLPGIGAFIPVSINQLYTFFEKKSSPNCYAAVAFAAKIAGVPTPFNYTKDDIWYKFPLNYGNTDSANYSLTIGLASVGTLKQAGYRKNHVDGWGTITTPYYTTPVNCIRVRSEIHEIDSVFFGSTPFGFPRNSVEYKWLLNGGHYPALWVTTNITAGTEQIVNIRYRDVAREIAIPNNVNDVSDVAIDVKAYPVPATEGIVNLEIPAHWKDFYVTVFDINGKEVISLNNTATLHMEQMASGNYFAQITSGAQVTYVKIIR